MSVVQPFHRVNTGQTLRVVEDPERGIYWCNMHANLVAMPGRACFSTQLVDDIVDYQHDLAERLRIERAQAIDRLPHVVLASDNEAFNLGGDLDLFCRLIRLGDRARLLDYARRCVVGVHAFHAGLDAGAHTIALVQGDALGGGFEAALSCHTIVAEEGVQMGLPEVLFDLFPGMGAYSFLCQRIAPQHGRKADARRQHVRQRGIAPHGAGRRARAAGPGRSRRRGSDPQQPPHPARPRRHAPGARAVADGHACDEMMRITEIWVDTALQLGEKSLRTMDRLVRAQVRRSGVEAA